MRAIITLADPEALWNKVWHDYYSQFFNCLFGVDWVNDYKSQIVLHSEELDTMVEYLLGRFEIVMTTCLDEIVVPDPEKYKDLGDYMDKMGDVARCTGYHVMEMPGDEPLDRKNKVTRQRGFWIHDPLYDKPVISKIPLNRLTGNHDTVGEHYPVDPDLVMLHLRDSDQKFNIKRRKIIGLPDMNMEEVKIRQQQAVPIPEKYKII